MNSKSVVRAIGRGTSAVGNGALRLVIRNRFILAVGSLVWLIVRSGTQPRRITYPCQQAAAANVSAVAVAACAGMAAPRAWIDWIRRHRVVRNLLATVVLALILHSTITWFLQPAIPLALMPQQHQIDLQQFPALAFSSQVVYPSDEYAVVAVARDANADYEGNVSPFDPDANSAYEVTRRAVSLLGFGTDNNPLRDFITPGETVLIKPNLEGSGIYQHTNAAIVRPLIDFAIAAGAGEVIVAESAPVGSTQKSFDGTGYTQLIKELQERDLPVKVTLMNLDDTSWSWVNLGEASAYAGSDITDDDLITIQRKSDYHSNTDHRGVTPDGILNWHALHDPLFDADVVINVPRLKIHGLMVNTMAIKNHVGITATSTSGGVAGENFSRIAHYGSNAGPDHMVRGYGNDISWRELANINRALHYWKDGKLHDTPQRKVLNVMDAVICGDGNHGGGPRVHLGYVLASVDSIAIDAVASRLMRYDFRMVPLINNAMVVPSHPWGTNDPASILVLGDPIDKDVNHPFTGNRWNGTKEFDLTIISDEHLAAPAEPSIRVVETAEAATVTATAKGAGTAFLVYDAPEAGRRAVRMARDGETFTAPAPPAGTTWSVSLQDRFFNTTGSLSETR